MPRDRSAAPAQEDRPTADLTLPPREAALLSTEYARARVILEYGSGGSTLLAARQPGKLVFSVESDRRWAEDLQLGLDREAPPSPAVIYPVDIGPTGDWGRPRDDRAWRRFHRYPLAIWDEPFFRHPDVVLIDGRFRAACLVTVCLRITRPVTVLFDDYANRPAYHAVERLARPAAIVGRMARFDLSPCTSCTSCGVAAGLLAELLTHVTCAPPPDGFVSYRGRVPVTGPAPAGDPAEADA
jgi:hypothetical protein